MFSLWVQRASKKWEYAMLHASWGLWCLIEAETLIALTLGPEATFSGEKQLQELKLVPERRTKMGILRSQSIGAYSSSL